MSVISEEMWRSSLSALFSALAGSWKRELEDGVSEFADNGSDLDALGNLTPNTVDKHQQPPDSSLRTHACLLLTCPVSLNLAVLSRASIIRWAFASAPQQLKAETQIASHTQDASASTARMHVLGIAVIIPPFVLSPTGHVRVLSPLERLGAETADALTSPDDAGSPSNSSN
jgi:hypothetical protein